MPFNLGRDREAWLQFTAEAGPGDFIFIPPYVPHQEINASTNERLECVLVRSDQEPVVVTSTSRRSSRRKRCRGSTRSTGIVASDAIAASDSRR